MVKTWLTEQTHLGNGLVNLPGVTSQSWLFGEVCNGINARRTVSFTEETGYVQGNGIKSRVGTPDASLPFFDQRVYRQRVYGECGGMRRQRCACHRHA